MNLNHLTDKILVLDLKRLVQSERELSARILHYIKEVESRKLFSDYGFSSMMDFLIRELGYSEGAASRRLQAARLLQEIPEIEKKLVDGTLSMTNLNKAAGFMRKEQIEESVRKKEILKKIENKTSREADRILQDLGPEKPLPREGLRPVAKDIQQMKVNISEEVYKALTEIRSLLGIRLLNDEFFQAIAKEAKENIFRRRFKLTPKGRVTHTDVRNPSNFDKREAYRKSNGVCEKCGGLFLLQVDHITPHALGGSSKAQNLRLLCFHCNQRERIKAKL